MRIVLVLAAYCAAGLYAQSVGNSGTIEGSVLDPSGAAVPKVEVTLHNQATGFSQAVLTENDGSFRFTNIPPNSYHLEVHATGFAAFSQDVVIRNSLPVRVDAKLTLGSATSTVTVEGVAETIENDPSAHVDVDRSQLLKLPSFDPGGGLSQAITYSTGGVAAESNGMFHPLGDHAQTTFVIDGQPISDQQSKVFSTQLPTSAIQGMELITGTPNAEFGDKTSLVAQVTTRSGLGAGKLFGSVDATYGNFGV